MNKTLKIACIGHSQAALDAFTEFQGELKTLSAADYEALRHQMAEGGFSFPLNVWKDGDGLFILDGHQRLRTLKKMQEEGWQIPELPYSLVEADSVQEAKRKLLAAASQYGKATEAGLAAFLKEVQITPIELAANFPLPGINMPKFVEVNFPKASSDEGDISQAMQDFQETPVAGSAGDSKAMPVSQVKMVQLFFNQANHSSFMHMADKLGQKFSTTNLTDTVLAAMKAAYESN